MSGAAIYSGDIRKHRNDCLRLIAIVPGDVRITLPKEIVAVMDQFIAALTGAEVEPRSLGLGPITKEDLINALRQTYRM